MSSSTSDNDYLRSYGPTLVGILTTLFASYFTLTTLLQITSQRELLIGIFLAIWVYVKYLRVFINDVCFYEESADFFRLVIQVSNEDQRRKIHKEEKEIERGYGLSEFPRRLYINEDDDVIITVETTSGSLKEIVYLNKKDPVKLAFLQLCDFVTNVVAIVIISILINVYISLLDLATLYWYNYIVVFSVPCFLIFVFIICKQY